MKSDLIGLYFLGVIILFIGGYVWGFNLGVRSVQRKAVICKKAVYDYNQYGDPIFSWK